MPRTALRRGAGAWPGNGKVTYQDAASLSLLFGTSYQAACYRLKSLNCVNRQELDELLRKRGIRIRRLLNYLNPLRECAGV